MDPSPSDAPDEPTAGRIVNERNLYFTGKALTARDFTGEQSFHVSRHRLHNRLLHGWGVVCGLGVKVNPACEKDGLIVGKGVAVDGFGRELIVGGDAYLRLPAPADGGTATTPLGVAPVSPPYVLCLYYGSDPIEYAPALYTEQTCDPGLLVPGRLRETPRLVFVSKAWFDTTAPGCWKSAAGPEGNGCPTPEPDPSCPDCSAWQTDASGCMHITAPCGGLVALAVVTPAVDSPPQPLTVDTLGRRTLIVDPCRSLTHVSRFNWRHGGTMSLGSIEKEGLVVEFDRPVRPAEGWRTGVNAFTFVAEYRTCGQWKALECQQPPKVDEDCPTRAAYHLRSKYFHDREHCRRVIDKVVRVTLKCDFIPDLDGQPVDGNFLNGRLPSGDGVPGGTFESWFRVGKEEPYKVASQAKAAEPAQETEQ